jgi:hypothetical protein
MSKLPLLINAVTISVSFSDKEYGKGQEFFQNISAKIPADYTGIPLERLDDVCDHSLDMFFAAWKSILTDRFIAGNIKGEEYKTILAAATARIEKVRGYLRKHESDQSHS